MDTLQIYKVLACDPETKRHFRWVGPKDKLEKTARRPALYVANTDPSGKPGRHWVAMFLEADGTGTFFDSFGRAPSAVDSTFEKFIEKHSDVQIVWNTIPIQCPVSMTCGLYCLYVLCWLCRGFVLDEILSDFDPNDLLSNDDSVLEWIDRNFPCELPFVDTSALIRQTCFPLHDNCEMNVVSTMYQ